MRIDRISSFQDGPLRGKFEISFKSDSYQATPSQNTINIPFPTNSKPSMLVICDDLTHYLAKCHESFLTGLRSCFNVKFFGVGREGYFDTHAVQEVISKLYGSNSPDIIFEDCEVDNKSRIVPRFKDISNFEGVYCVNLCDFWNILSEQVENYINSIIEYEVDYIVSYFPHPLYIFEYTEIHNKLIYSPPTVDPSIFNDWKMNKEYDVGFLAAGTQTPSPYYPERWKIYKQLLDRVDLRFLHAEHPCKGLGSFFLKSPHPLVGKNFSRHINACRGFINTGGIYKTPNARTVEIMASASTLFAFEHFDLGALHLEDGVNYVCIDEDNALDKIDYYLARPDECVRIGNAAYETAMKYHTGVTRAQEFKSMLMGY